MREQNIGLVGIGAMTRMIAKAYRMADAIRAVGVPVVMGGPHVTVPAMPMLWLSAKPTKPGQKLYKMPRVARDSCGQFT